MRRTFGTDTEAIFGAIIVVLFALAAIFILMTSGCSNPVALNPPEPVELSLTVGHSGILLFWTESSADDFIRYDVYCSEVSGELGISIGSNFEREDGFRAIADEIRDLAAFIEKLEDLARYEDDSSARSRG